MHFNCVSFCIAQDAPDIIMNDGQLQSKNISFGDALSLSTCFTSEPYPVITWLHNGTIINHKGDPDVIIHTCNELRVAIAIDHFTRCTCTWGKDPALSLV